MKTLHNIILACDFETSVYDGQTRTDVWSAAYTEVGNSNPDNVLVLGNISSFMEELFKPRIKTIAYFHNLKFDGVFIVDYLLNEGYEFNRVHVSKLMNKEFTCSISDRGQWYTITVKRYNTVIEFRDSLKLLPMGLKKVGESFHTEHQKLDMTYKGFRYPNCPITEEELSYIKNDVLVLSEALKAMFDMGVNGLTIGSVCMKRYKDSPFFDFAGKNKKEAFRNYFPDLSQISLDTSEYASENADEYIRHSYRGGYCHLKRGAGGEYVQGWTADINSSYPSNMHSQSGNEYPYGKPIFWRGTPCEQDIKGKYYFIRFSCRFRLKPGYLPTVQIKGNFLYPSSEYLETSDIWDFKTGKYVRYYSMEKERKEARVTLTMTCTDWEIFNEHYDIFDLVIFDGCSFMKAVGMFDEYIDYWYKIKQNSTGGMRELAKLYLNNLYGKFASNTDSSYKIPYLGEDGVVHFQTVQEYEKELVYIAVGSAITSYARRFVIKAAQANYDNFIYCDTDSIHCKGNSEPKGIRIHPTALLCWKLESNWDRAIFVRQKTYLEHITHKDGKPVEEPYYSIKCAGMSEAAKKEFLSEHDVKEFTVNLKLNQGLKPVIMKGGVVLKDKGFKMRPKKWDVARGEKYEDEAINK